MPYARFLRVVPSIVLIAWLLGVAKGASAACSDALLEAVARFARLLPKVIDKQKGTTGT